MQVISFIIPEAYVKCCMNEKISYSYEEILVLEFTNNRLKVASSNPIPTWLNISLNSDYPIFPDRV